MRQTAQCRAVHSAVILAGLFAGEIVETSRSIGVPREGNIVFVAIIVNEDGIGDCAPESMIVQHGERPIALVLQRDQEVAHALMGDSVRDDHPVQQ